MHVALFASLTPTVVFTDVGHSFREAFSMFLETLWALVLGFGLSGMVQAFIPRSQMQKKLGHRRAPDFVRASIYGMISSSCSYAASAMARSLFIRGADFLAAMVFMFASTNLVIELGIVLLVLIGWQFVVAEFVGGVIMVILLVVFGGLWFRGKSLSVAQAIAEGSSAGVVHGDAAEIGAQPVRERLRSRAGWSDAARYSMGDLKMLRREMVLGFVVAGFLAVLVPTSWWNALFLHGHGFWTTLENVTVGPFVAVISFVCSVGNIPLAAALWKGGISFGGVVSFIFADLITLPLLIIYAKQYGRRMMWRMLGVFWFVMSLAGLITEELFRAVGGLPQIHPTVITSASIGVNAVTGLDLVALVVLGVLYWLAHHHGEDAMENRFAIDPICGMQVEIAHAPASVSDGRQTTYFCSDHCRGRFNDDPANFTGRTLI